MNFNHLISRIDKMYKCCNDEHAYYPCGHIEAMVGDHVAVRFLCKKCNRMVTSILDADEYQIHRNILETYINDRRG